MWTTLLIVFVLGFYIYQVEKRVRSIEETRGPGYSHRFSVNALEALLRHKKFGEITGIKSASGGKEYKDWSKADKGKWRKPLAENIIDKARVNLTYLQSENAYFVGTYKSRPSFVHRDCNTNLLYSKIIVGDETGFKDNINFSIYERLIQYDKGSYGWVLTPCLEYQDGEIIDGKREFTVLCDFPLFRTDLTDKEVKKLGFEVERRGGDDIYEDSFGEKQLVPAEVKYKKNGVEIRYAF